MNAAPSFVWGEATTGRHVIVRTMAQNGCFVVEDPTVPIFSIDDLTLHHLDAKLIRRAEHEGFWTRDVDTLGEAQGVSFLCPVCYLKNDGPIGTHRVICWFLERGVPDAEKPGPGRWNAVGSSLSDLTLQAGSSSVLLRGGCNAHFFVRNGRIVKA